MLRNNTLRRKDMRVKKKAAVAALAAVLCLVLIFPLCLKLIGRSFANANTKKTQETEMSLRYDEPASQAALLSFPSTGVNVSDDFNRWQQTVLPLGNGMIGASVYGEIGKERILFNEKTLWTGGPSASRPNYNGGNKTGVIYDNMTMAQLYQKIQTLFSEGKNSEASNLCSKLVGDKDGYGAYQSWGEISLDFGITDEATDYRRGLNLNTGVAYVDFTAGGTEYKREYFVSYPDNVLVIRLTGSREMSVGVKFTSSQGATQTVTDGVLDLAGSLSDNGMLYHSQLRIADGTAGGSDNELSVTGKTVTLVVSAATDYAPDYPVYRTGESAEGLAQRVSGVAQAAVQKGYDELYRAHEADYGELYSRMKLDLGQEVPGVTTDELLANYKKGTASAAEERYLEVLLYQYGRYLTIASSRENSLLPSNLQGLWNPVGNPPWSSDYHMNVNLQMNYWPTYASNLAECAIPLINYVDSLREPGRVTAEVYTGVASGEGEENGFTAHTQNTPFGWTCPGWDFSWGWSPAAVPWILQNVYEYFEYTQDVDYLRDKIYPMMREETVYFDRILVEDPKTGRKLTAPTYSPEHGPYTMGNTYEQSLIWQLYEDTISAAERLGADEDKIADWKATQRVLNPIEVGTSGQIKEWYDETALGKTASGSISKYQPNHRHMSHLLGLFPGDLINVDDNGENGWMDAAIVSLNNRGDKSTGWAMGQRINAWARTGDGGHAYRLIRELFQNGIYPNLFDAHPPFQIDGNFGYTSGVNEMLMQSNLGYINLLPSLPGVWANGSVSGMVARGNFVLDFAWERNSLTGVEITSRAGGVCTLQYPGIGKATVTDGKGTPIKVTVLSDDRICFETEKGETFSVKDVPFLLSAPDDAAAYRLADDEVLLQWTPVPEAQGYVVYRRTGNGAWLPVGRTADAEFTDATFRTDDYGKLQWAVAAYGEDGSPSAKAQFPSAVEITQKDFLNDDDPAFTYGSGWTVQKTFTESYNKDVHYTTSEAQVSFRFYGDGFVAYGRRHAVFALCDVYVDGELVQKGVSGYRNGDYGYNQPNGDPEEAAIVRVNDLEYGLHEVELKFYPDPNYANRKRADFDCVKILREKAAENVRERYTVSFDRGTSGAGELPYLGRPYAGTEVALPECALQSTGGELFAGWSDGNTVYAAGDFYTVSKDVTFTAVWREIPRADYRVEHAFEDLNGQFTADASRTETRNGVVGEPTAASALNDPEGFTAQSFEQGTIAEDGSTVVTIRYTRNSYVLKFMNEGAVYAQSEVKYGEKISLPGEDPHKRGFAFVYTFIGWADYEADMTMPARDVTFKAQYESKLAEYTVTFRDAEGNIIGTVKGGYEAALTPPEAPSREGYRFVGWSPELSQTITENTEFTAVYEKIDESGEAPDDDKPDPEKPAEDGKRGANIPVIVGCSVAGAVVAAGAIAGTVVYIRKRRKH